MLSSASGVSSVLDVQTATRLQATVQIIEDMVARHNLYPDGPRFTGDRRTTHHQTLSMSAIIWNQQARQATEAIKKTRRLAGIQRQLDQQLSNPALNPNFLDAIQLLLDDLRELGLRNWRGNRSSLPRSTLHRTQ